MLVNQTITKKVLEKLVHETFSEFGVINCSSLLDSLKLLGFYYATNAGISINLEDLKTPNWKEECIETANQEISTKNIHICGLLYNAVLCTPRCS